MKNMYGDYKNNNTDIQHGIRETSRRGPGVWRGSSRHIFDRWTAAQVSAVLNG